MDNGSFENYNEYNANGPIPGNYNMPPKPSNTLGIVSLILGIISTLGLCMCIGPIPGIIAIVLGILQIKRTPNDKAMSIAGIVTGAIGTLMSLVIMIIFILGVSFSASDLQQFNIQEFYDQIEPYDDI